MLAYSLVSVCIPQFGRPTGLCINLPLFSQISAGLGGSPRACPGLASGLALAVRPAGSALIRLRGQRHAAGVSRVAGCEAPLRPERPTRTMRGVPTPMSVTFTAAAQLVQAGGLILAAGHGTGRIRRAPHAAGHPGHRARQLGAL